MPLRRYASALLLLSVPLTAANCERIEDAHATKPPEADSSASDATLPVEPVSGAALPLALPTRNAGLLTGDPEGFYQGVNKDTVAGLRDAAWEAGQYGFVRDPVPARGTEAGRIFRRLHEGLDIRPLHRDAAGEPLDTVRAVARGRVAYVSSGYSSYGNYVVVEHAWSGSPVFSLYAHLDSAGVSAGDTLARGQPLGRMGYTGRGLGRDRAHVHLEVALLLNRNELAWHDRYIGQANPHGNFFGTNLAGVDVAALYRATRLNPTLTFPEFVRSQPPGFRVLLPGDRPLDLLTRYPWLLEEKADAQPDPERAWVVTFTQAGVPIQVGRRAEQVDEPEVDAVARYVREGRLSTNRLLTRTIFGYELSDVGRRYLALLATTEDGPPAW